jgi:hypothetical protein
VTVLADGFAFEGKTYDSLSNVALAITGTKWNGPVLWPAGRTAVCGAAMTSSGKSVSGKSVP